jgi:hypothetical protein
MDKNVNPNADYPARGRIKTAPRSFLVVLATMILFGCSGPITSPPPPGPSGIVTTFPASTAAAPFVVHCHNSACPSQTFVVSELGYGGLFAFRGSDGILGRTEPFTAPAGVSVTLTGHCIGLFGRYTCVSYKITVHDSLGNASTIYAQYAWD